MSNTNEINFIEIAQNVYFLRGLNYSEIKAVAKYYRTVECKAEELLVVQDFKSEALYFLFEGVCGVYSGDLDRNHLVDVKISGDCFGEISFFTGQNATASVMAHQDATVFVLTRTDFEDLITLHPRIGYVIYKNIFHAISDRFKRLPPLFANLFLWGYNSKESIVRNNAKNHAVKVLKLLMVFIWLSTIFVGGYAGNMLFNSHFHKYFPDTFTGRFVFVITGMIFLSSILLSVWFIIDFFIVNALKHKRSCKECKFYQVISDKPLCLINFMKKKGPFPPEEVHKCEYFEGRGEELAKAVGDGS